jgi:hypothetical protein
MSPKIPETEDDDLDPFLSAQLASEPLPGEAFARQVVARIEASAQRRRRTLSGAAWIAAALAAGLALSLPETARPGFEVTPGIALGALGLLALCGLIWIGTESRTGHPV